MLCLHKVGLRMTQKCKLAKKKSTVDRADFSFLSEVQRRFDMGYDGLKNRPDASIPKVSVEYRYEPPNCLV